LPGVAPAGATVAVTTTPLSLTGLLFASCSWSIGCRANVTPLCALLDGAVVITSFVAVPAVPVAVNVTELPVKPLAVAVTVFVPTVFPRVHDVTVAVPLAFVTTVVGLVGLRDPLPAVTANVTSTPATGLPLASVTITAGGEATAVPAGADCVVGLLFAIATAAPALRVSVPEMTGVSPLPPKLRV